MIPLSCRLDSYREMIAKGRPPPSDFKAPSILFLVNFHTGVMFGPFVALSPMTFDGDSIFGISTGGKLFEAQVAVGSVLPSPLRSAAGSDWCKGPSDADDTVSYMNVLTGLGESLKSSVPRGVMTDEAMYALGNQVVERVTACLSRFESMSGEGFKVPNFKPPRQEASYGLRIPTIREVGPTGSHLQPTASGRLVNAYELRRPGSRLRCFALPAAATHREIVYDVLCSLMKCIPMCCRPSTPNGLEFSVADRRVVERLLRSLDFVSKLLSYAFSAVESGDMLKCRFIYERIEKHNYASFPTELHRLRLDRLRRAGNRVAHESDSDEREGQDDGAAAHGAAVLDCVEAVVEEYRVQACYEFATALCGEDRRAMEVLCLGHGSHLEEVAVEIHIQDVRRERRREGTGAGGRGNDDDDDDESFPPLPGSSSASATGPRTTDEALDPDILMAIKLSEETAKREEEMRGRKEEREIEAASKASLKPQQPASSTFTPRPTAAAFVPSPHHPPMTPQMVTMPPGLVLPPYRLGQFSCFKLFPRHVAPKYHYEYLGRDGEESRNSEIFQLVDLCEVMVLGSKSERVRLTLSDGNNSFFAMVAHDVLDRIGGIGSLHLHGFYKVPFCRPSLRAASIIVDRSRRDRGEAAGGGAKPRPASYSWFYTDVVEVLSLEVFSGFGLKRNAESGACEVVGEPKLVSDFGRGSVEVGKEIRGLISSKVAFER